MEVEKLTYKGYTINIYTDENAENPREAFENVGKMIYSHRRYKLGDEEYKHSSAENWEENSSYYFAENYANDIMSFINTKYNKKLTFIPDYLNKKMLRYIAEWLKENVYILPLYIYEHSGVTIKTSSFSCPWDSGMVGFIYVTHKKAKEDYGDNNGEFETFEKRVQVYLTNEVEEFDSYITGAVYRYEVKDEDKNEIDSCSGYYGYNHEESGLQAEAYNAIDIDIENNGVEERRKEAAKALEERERAELARLKAKYE